MLFKTKTDIKIKHKLPLIVSSIIVVMGLVTVPQALAEELSITGNGAESNNQVQVSQSSDTSVSQNNQNDTSNDIKVKENTGENKASENTDGSTSIKTGDANSNTSVTNSGNVSSATVNNCNCDSNGSVSISGNGAFSNNNANIDSSFNNTVTIDQNANIRNNIDDELITGRNKANDNTNGDVLIHTGNISVIDRLLNSLNQAHVGISGGPLQDFLVKIFGNGAFSDNDANADINNENKVAVNNTADIINNLKERYVTGENKANDNTDGDVAVVTGDITVEKTITNAVNVSDVEIKCDCEKVAVAAPTSPTTPAVTTTETSSPSEAVSPAEAQASSPAEAVMGASAENILPATGNNWFFLAMLGNVLMLILGAYLRLRSGRSPGVQI